METSDLFNRIAGHYDRWSNLLSAEGIRVWRHFAVEELAIGRGHSVLDVGCGTGTATLLMAAKAGPNSLVAGLDISKDMLAQAASRALHAGWPNIRWTCGQAEHLPFADNGFDRVTAQFSLRNTDNWMESLGEMVRVLKPGGRLVLLDVVQPATSMGSLAWNGLKTVTQHLGRDSLKPYQWLGLSVEHAPTSGELVFEAGQIGLKDVKVHHWLGDLVMVLRGEKADNVPKPSHRDGVSVIWAVDGSLTSLQAAAWINTAVAPQSIVDIVAVVPTASVAPEVADNDAKAWRRHVRVAEAQLVPERFLVRTHVLQGAPGPQLLRFARHQHTGVIIVGSKGRSARADKWVGSVARYVAENSVCPVLMIPLKAMPSPDGDADDPETSVS